MAQLNLTLPEPDVAAIRAQARERGVSPSELLRALALGEREASDPVQARLDDHDAQLASLTAAVRALEGSAPLEQLEALERRLSVIEELAQRY